MKKHPRLSLWVTEDGEVYGPRGKRATQLDRYGYLRLSCKDGCRHIKVAVHKLVAETYLGCGAGLTVNHKNGNKLDNSVLNLEYLSAGENTAHSFRQGHRGFCHPVEYEGVLYYSKRERERRTGVPRQ